MKNLRKNLCLTGLCLTMLLAACGEQEDEKSNGAAVNADAEQIQTENDSEDLAKEVEEEEDKDKYPTYDESEDGEILATDKGYVSKDLMVGEAGGAGIKYNLVHEFSDTSYQSFGIHVGVPKGGKPLDNVSNKNFILVDWNGNEYAALNESEIKRITGNDYPWTDKGIRIEADSFERANIVFKIPRGDQPQYTKEIWRLKVINVMKDKTIVLPVEISYR